MSEDTGALVGAIVAVGCFALDAPAHFGGGDGSGADMVLVRHADGTPYLPGSSLAGAARAATNARLAGWSACRSRDYSEPDDIRGLFGSSGDDGDQSALIIDDADAEGECQSLVRDGVQIDAATGTAAANAKYDLEVLPAGTSFGVRMELLLREGAHPNLRRRFYELLGELSRPDGPVRLGARTGRGLGKGHVADWRVRDLDFSKPDDVEWWLGTEREPASAWTPPADASEPLEDKRAFMAIEASFEVVSSLLIRSYPTDALEPDMVPVRTGGRVSVPAVPGTSVAGALRQRALRIARTLAATDSKADEFVWDLFGPDPAELKNRVEARLPRGVPRKAVRARIRIDEGELAGADEYVQSRVHIDPFTGGVHQGPFDEQAAWSGAKAATLALTFAIEEPSPAERGLAMLLLKDLWLEDLPIGGGAGIGRGTLRGQSATVKWHENTEDGCACGTLAFSCGDESASRGRTGSARVRGVTPEQAATANGWVTALSKELNCNE